MNKEDLKPHLLQLINDIQVNQSKFGCYPYPKTMRSILTASQLSPIAPKFADKPYYGIIKNKITLTYIVDILNELVEDGYLTTQEYKNKTRYLCTDKYDSYEKKQRISNEDLSILDDLLDGLE